MIKIFSNSYLFIAINEYIHLSFCDKITDVSH